MIKTVLGLIKDVVAVTKDVRECKADIKNLEAGVQRLESKVHEQDKAIAAVIFEVQRLRDQAGTERERNEDRNEKLLLRLELALARYDRGLPPGGSVLDEP